MSETPRPHEPAQEPPASNGMSRRTFIQAALLGAAALGLGKAAFDGAEQLPRRFAELQGYPEAWSDEQHLAWFAELERDLATAKTWQDRSKVIDRVLSLSDAYPNEIEKVLWVRDKKWEVNRQLDRVNLPNYSPTEDYINAMEGYAKRLGHTLELAGADRVAALLTTERTAAAPNERAEALDEVLWDAYALVDSTGIISEEFARELAHAIVRQQPDFLQVMQHRYAVEVQKNRQMLDFGSGLSYAIPLFEKLLK